MTFYEAAVEILRGAGRPLHVKKITELSIGQSLLTHVGRDPEKTMAARLTQELAKANGESLIRSVRPNVYALRDGVDPSEAKQTVQPRAADIAPEDERIDVSTDDELDDDAIIADDATDDDSTRSRGRRGGRGRSRSSQRNDSDDNNARASKRDNNGDDNNARAAKRDDDSDDNARAAKRDSQRRQDSRAQDSRSDDKRDERKDTRQRDDRRDDKRDDRRPSAARGELSPAAQRLAERAKADDRARKEAAGDLAGHIRDLLADATAPMSLQDISDALGETAYAHLPELPAAALESTLVLANARRTAAGEAPLFTTSVDGLWSLVAEDEGIAASYEALEAWQENHHALLVRRLERVLAKRTASQTLGIVALVMERLGYAGLELHDAEDNEIATFSARLAHGLSEERVAVRVFASDVPISRLDVMAFRGSLHHYNAARGIMITLGGHSLCAREQTEVPNLAPIDLLHDGKLAALMLRTQVGTTTMQVAVSSLDHAFFA